MIKQFFFVTFLLSCLSLSAQEWSVRYPSGHPSGYNHFHDGFVDANGVTFLVGQEGPSKDYSDAILFRVGPDGSHTSYTHNKSGFHSKANCIVEMSNDHLFVAGNLYNDTCDWLMVLIFDKELNLLEEKLYDKEVDMLSFGKSRGILDNHDNVIVSTYFTQDNGYKGVFYRGILFKFDQHGDTLRHRYLLADEPDPVSYLADFRLRQLWYKEQNETLLCLVPGFGGVMSFITFDSAFNYIEEHPIWNSQMDKSDRTLYRDCYTDHWFSENEALFFSSIGDADHNRLRVSRVTTQGEILEIFPLNARVDTIDDAAQPRCMAAPNDSTFYFSFHYHPWGYYPGTACVYQLNNQLEIVGYHIEDDHSAYRTCLIFPTSDGGCITVNDSCMDHPYATTTLPFVRKLSPANFVRIPWSVTQTDQGSVSCKAYPNPCNEVLLIPITTEYQTGNTRCQVSDLQGRTLMDCFIRPDGNLLHLDVSRLKAGFYHYRIYSNQKTLFSEKFLKK